MWSVRRWRWQHLGWSSERYASLAAPCSNLIAAVFALFVPIVLVRWFGLRRMIIAHFLALAVLAVAAGASFPGWQDDVLFMALSSGMLYPQRCCSRSC